jgi:methylsterol monooxygenase
MWFSALGTFVIHEVCYFGAHLFWTSMSYLPGASRYKIQPKAVASWSMQYRCLLQILFNHCCIELPMMMAVEPIFGGVLFGGTGLQLSPPFTSAWRIAWVVAASFVLEDFYFYWVHRFLHWGPIYRHVHKLHRKREKTKKERETT